MSFYLKKDWNSIKEYRHSFDWFESKWILNWSTNSINASILYEAIKLIKPKILIETGTFEDHGVYVMAKALQEIGNKATIYTIDYDNDPLTKLDEHSWLKLKQIRDENLSVIRERFSNVRIIYINGDSREVLPKLVRKIGFKWDFFYQDSMHFYEGIKSEWETIYQYANHNAVAVFDDISIKKVNFNQDGYRFCREFIESKHIGDWDFVSTEIGHHQFWIQKHT